MTRLLLADDHAIFRQGLRRLLQAWPEAEVVGEAADGLEAWELIQEKHPDLAILDIEMPQMRGIEIMRQVKEKELSTRIVLLTMHDEPALAFEAERAGAHGYVLKDNTFEELLEAIQKVAAGYRYMSPGVSENFQAFRMETGGTALSTREREVLQLIASGQSSKEIARTLDISPKTVETYRNRLMSKLNLHSVAELVRYAMRSGLLSE